MSGLFKGIETASVSGGGVYFLDGLYTVEIIKVSTIVSRKKDDLLIVEAKILETSNPARPVGMKCSWVANVTKHDAALGNIKGFCIAAGGGDENMVIDEAAIEFIVSKENPLAGTWVGLQCTTVKTRAGGDFTKHEWKAVPQPAPGLSLVKA